MTREDGIGEVAQKRLEVAAMHPGMLAPDVAWLARVELELRQAEQTRDKLAGPGDLLQSSASRMAAWILGHADPPYEVRMAALEAQSAVKDWTAVRATPTQAGRTEEE